MIFCLKLYSIVFFYSRQFFCLKNILRVQFAIGTSIGTTISYIHNLIGFFTLIKNFGSSIFPFAIRIELDSFLVVHNNLVNLPY